MFYFGLFCGIALSAVALFIWIDNTSIETDDAYAKAINDFFAKGIKSKEYN